MGIANSSHTDARASQFCTPIRGGRLPTVTRKVMLKEFLGAARNLERLSIDTHQ
jgi:hypothetical protein